MSVRILTRKQYKAIKRYDHNQMSNWASSMYLSGRQDAMDEMRENSLSLEDVAKALNKVKGIGEKRKALVIKELEGTAIKDGG